MRSIGRQVDRGSYDYAALNATANRLARALLSRGEAPPNPWLCCSRHGGEALAAIMAVLKAGKFYVVLDSELPAGSPQIHARRLDRQLDGGGRPIAGSLRGSSAAARSSSSVSTMWTRVRRMPISLLIRRRTTWR
jgi:hypothetical protein